MLFCQKQKLQQENSSNSFEYRVGSIIFVDFLGENKIFLTLNRLKFGGKKIISKLFWSFRKRQAYFNLFKTSRILQALVKVLVLNIINKSYKFDNK